MKKEYRWEKEYKCFKHVNASGGERFRLIKSESTFTKLAQPMKFIQIDEEGNRIEIKRAACEEIPCINAVSERGEFFSFHPNTFVIEEEEENSQVTAHLS